MTKTKGNAYVCVIKTFISLNENFMNRLHFFQLVKCTMQNHLLIVKLVLKKGIGCSCRYYLDSVTKQSFYFMKSYAAAKISEIPAIFGGTPTSLLLDLFMGLSTSSFNSICDSGSSFSTLFSLLIPNDCTLVKMN